MDELKKAIEQAVNDELRRASEKWGYKLNSPHEAYAVIKEELEETIDYFDAVQNALNAFWRRVKDDAQDRHIDASLENMEMYLLGMLAEGIQTMAMVKKARRSLNGKSSTKTEIKN